MVIFFSFLIHAISIQSFAAEEVGMVWSVQGENNTVYLAGSIHLLRSSDYPLPQAYDQAFADSDALVLEITEEEMSDPQSAMLLLKAAQCEGGKTVYDYLKPATVEVLESRFGEDLGAYAMFKGFKPWFLVMTITVSELAKIGVSPQDGVETHFTKKAKERNLPVSSLESVQDQLSIFDGLTDDQQDSFLRVTVEELSSMENEFDRMIALWKSGKDAELAAMMNDSMDSFPKLKEKLLNQRNANWVSQLKNDFLKREENVMLLVGSAHLAGEDGVISSLKKEQFDVVRVK